MIFHISIIYILGNEKLINCLHHGPIPAEVINNYCYIAGTFTIPTHYAQFDKDGRPRLGNVISSPVVGPYNAGLDENGKPITEIEVKSYYQWVPFMLFLQGVMFYVPHIIYKGVEGGKLKVQYFYINYKLEFYIIYYITRVSFTEIIHIT